MNNNIIIEKYIKSIIELIEDKKKIIKSIRVAQEYFNFIFSASAVEHVFVVVDDSNNIITGCNLSESLLKDLE